MPILNTIIKSLALGSVKFYRKFISPYKGFHCGHAHHTGSLTCSTYGLQQLQKQPSTIEALRLIRHRLKACSHVVKLYQPVSIVNNMNEVQLKRNNMHYRKQAGFVDCDVGGCDAPSCDVPDCKMPHCDLPDLPHCNFPKFDICDVADVCDCGELFDFNKKEKQSSILPNMTTTDAATGILVAGAAARAMHKAKKEGSYIIPNFQLLDELENDYLLYQYEATKEYYKIHKKCIDWPLEDILNCNTEPETYKFSEDKVKKILKYRKKVGLKKD